MGLSELSKHIEHPLNYHNHNFVQVNADVNFLNYDNPISLSANIANNNKAVSNTSKNTKHMQNGPEQV